MKKTRLLICVLVLIIFAVTAFFAVNQIREYLYPREYTQLVEKYSNQYSVPESLLYAVIYTESNFDANATSYVGAKGLMQLMPDTLEWLSRLMDETNPTGEITDPETNIKYGTYYLSYLYQRFNSWETALAAYNAGHNRIAGWLSDTRYSDDGVNLKDIPIEETKNYVNRVLETKKQYQEIYYNGEE